MDPIDSIKPRKDSTLAMLVEAQRRGWTLHHGTLDDIWLRDGEAFRRLTDPRVADDPERWFDLGAAAVPPLAQMAE
jgi:glutathione synthase